MMIISRKHISRRALLRGVGGVAVALPFLDAMHPAVAAERLTSAAPARRFGVVYYPHGVVAERWLPSGEGATFRLGAGLAPLEPMKSKLTVLAGLSACPDRTLAEFHDRGLASMLTGVEMTRGQIKVAPSVDQIIAAKLGQETQFGSLQSAGEDQAPEGTPFYRDATTQLPCETNPRVLFERLFGDAAKIDPAATAARNAADKSALDLVREQIAGLSARLGAADRLKLQQYLDSIRDVERRIQIAEAKPLPDLPAAQRPAGRGADWLENVKLMIDLNTLAFQADLTRVVSFMMAKDSSLMTYPQIGISYQHHEASHHNYDADKLEALHKINVHHSELFAYWLGKLEAIKEPSGSVLDNSIMLFMSNLSNPTVHSQRDLPIMLAGGGAGRLKTGGRFVRLPGDVAPWGGPPGVTGPPNSVANLHLTLCDKFDVPLERLGDSTGRLSILEA